MMTGRILFWIAADASDKHFLSLKEQVTTVTTNQRQEDRNLTDRKRNKLIVFYNGAVSKRM